MRHSLDRKSLFKAAAYRYPIQRPGARHRRDRLVNAINDQAGDTVVDWPEPFGLALIEAMANGTPVIAFRRGSVPEIIDRKQQRSRITQEWPLFAIANVADELDRRILE